jgi:pimeloyl-ACP methyl ester carboxylesterase
MHRACSPATGHCGQAPVRGAFEAVQFTRGALVLLLKKVLRWEAADPSNASTSENQSYGLIARVFDGQSEGLTRDDILDNITFYWLTNTGVSSARLYWENKLVFFAPKGVTVPTVVSVFPDEICPAPRSWAEKAYPKLIYYQRHPKGGHFAAWEQPQAIVDDLRAGFRSLR